MNSFTCRDKIENGIGQLHEPNSASTSTGPWRKFGPKSNKRKLLSPTMEEIQIISSAIPSRVTVTKPLI